MNELKSRYRSMLKEGYKATKIMCGYDGMSRLAFVGEHIFDFITYDSEYSELFARKMLDVCAAINSKTTFVFIDKKSGDGSNYQWYLTMVNMPFLAKRLDWGTSIRGAWWDDAHLELCTDGLYPNGQQVTEHIFTTEEWEIFIQALCEFAGETT